MRALLVFILMCMVSAVRPAPLTRVTGDAKVDAAQSHADFVPARRVVLEPRDSRSVTDGVVTTAPAIPLPLRFAFLERHALDGRDTTPVVFARSARGPPVG